MAIIASDRSFTSDIYLYEIGDISNSGAPENLVDYSTIFESCNIIFDKDVATSRVPYDINTANLGVGGKVIIGTSWTASYDGYVNFDVGQIAPDLAISNNLSYVRFRRTLTKGDVVAPANYMQYGGSCRISMGELQITMNGFAKQKISFEGYGPLTITRV